jgi:hypothetical protein
VRTIDFVPGAELELQGAARRYEQARPGLGAEFLQEISTLVERIALEGHTFPRWRDGLPFRKAVVLHRFPFAVFFVETEQTVQIYAVAHGSRPPGYWMHRVGQGG